MAIVNDKYRGTTTYVHVLAELVRAAQYRGRMSPPGRGGLCAVSGMDTRRILGTLLTLALQGGT